MRKAETRAQQVDSGVCFVSCGATSLALPTADREVGDVAGGSVSDIGTDERQELDCVAGAHHLAATR